MSTCHLYSFTPQTPQQAFRAVSSVGAFLKAPSAPACRRQLYHSFAKDSRLWLSAVDHVSCPGLSRRLFGTLSAQIKSLPKFGKPTRITSHLAVDTTKASIPQLLSRRLSISSQCRNAATGAAPKSPHDDVTKIFGKGVEKDLAIEILSKVQKQRRQGTLDQTLDYQPELLDKALKYLRARYPLDEEAAIIARLDRELDGEWNLPQKNPNKSRSGRSGLQEIREINKQKYEAKKEKEAQQARLEQTQNVENSRPAEAQLVSRKQKEVVGDDGMVRRPGHRPMPAWVARYYDNATARTIPQLTKAQRLIPSAIFTIGAVGIAILFAYAYSPPAADARLFPGVAPAAAAVMGIIALNFLIFVSWKVPPLWKFMNSNFMVIPAIPKAFSMLGAEFSHQQFLHMFSNMLGIWFLGTRIHDDIGRGPFFALVVCGAVVPSFCALTANVVNSVFITATVGASGIVCTLLGTSCYLREGLTITLPFLDPRFTDGFNTGVILAFFIALEAVALLRSGLAPTALINTGKSHIDRVGHLAGYGVGIAAGYAICKNNPYWRDVKRESFWRKKPASSGE